ncbi:hypothetical protein SELMODRAFT_415523 [Selaginella moellendorffii]|uniref:Uncharacterized protein n=1 Tax=Selaginella moellendorffii TaxID=88036 RepID=D8RWE3_SELML|nr:hypothetical protein SELMODRAFT_415523 [Selaginella moellendorffii]
MAIHLQARLDADVFVASTLVDISSPGRGSLDVAYPRLLREVSADTGTLFTDAALPNSPKHPDLKVCTKLAALIEGSEVEIDAGKVAVVKLKALEIGHDIDAQAIRSLNLTIDIMHQACQEGHWPGDPRVWISPAAPVLECDHLWTSSLDSKENWLENALQLFKLLSSDAMTYTTIDALQHRGCKAVKLLGVDGNLMQELLQSRLSIKRALCTSRMTW